MKKNTIIWLVVIAVLILIVISLYLLSHKSERVVETPPPAAPVEHIVHYYCDEGPLTASFTDKQVVLTLAEDQKVTLPQVESGSGVRYQAETLTFWTKGSNAFLTDSDQPRFTNCVAGTVTANGDSQRFTADNNSFSFSYPSIGKLSGGDGSYTTDWMFNSTSTGMVLAKVIIPREVQPQTNFSEARLTIGTSSQPEALNGCLAPTSGAQVATSTLNINGTPYTVITAEDAGAGNFYQTTSYRAVHDGQCYAIEYTIHTTNIGNYSPDQGITEYDAATIKALLENIVQSFRWL
jgi:membrane-bound inhibitor of C-type lysozyme